MDRSTTNEKSASAAACRPVVVFNTPRFDESVRFYRTFLGLEPVKLKPGYAKFDVAEPGLNLTLNASSDTGPGALNHLGIQVQSTAAVREAAERLKAGKDKPHDDIVLAAVEEYMKNNKCKVYVAKPPGAGKEALRRGRRDSALSALGVR